MKYFFNQHNLIKLFSKLEINQFLLLGITFGLIAIHLSITIRQDIDIFLWSSLYLCSALFLIWRKRLNLNFASDIYSSLLGLFFITIVLYKISFSPSYLFLLFSPWVSALGLSLMASSFKRLKQYTQELILLFFLQVPQHFIKSALDITPLTAKFAAYILWYLGFPVSIQGFYIVLPHGSVDVYRGCSGLDSIITLLTLAILLLFLFPLKHIKKNIVIPIIFMLVGFVINGFRVALLAILTNSQKDQAFRYWHQGNGSFIFFMVAVGLSCLFYYFLLLKETSTNCSPSIEASDR